MKQLVGLAGLALPLAACGRTGFDARAADAALPDAAASLSCDGARFATEAATTALAATATTDGYIVLAVGTTGAVTGAAFAFPATGQTLAQTTDPVAITTNATGSAAGVALDVGALIEVPYGRPDTTGTALIPLNHDLSPRGPATTHDQWIAGAGMLARAHGAAGDAIVLLGQDRTTRNIDAQPVDASGGFLGNPLTLIAGSTNPQSATLSAAGDRLLATWVASGPSDAVARAQLFDSQLVPKTDVIQISSDPVNGAEFPRAAYAAGADRFLFAWYQKVNGGTDEVWISLRDGRNLAEVSPPQRITTQGVLPVIAAGDDSFLIVWQSTGPKLSAARVSKDGALTPLGVTNTGGNASGWDVVTRDGQPTLVWVEAGGTGPNLWLNPLCN